LITSGNVSVPTYHSIMHTPSILDCVL